MQIDNKYSGSYIIKKKHQTNIIHNFVLLFRYMRAYILREENVRSFV